MELRTRGLALDLMFGTPDGEGWILCNAVVNVPGFRGDFDFHMLKTDLEFFRSQLATAIDVGDWPTSIRLVSTDPGIEISFRIEGTGQIQGSYRLGPGSEEPELSGGFEMDQTFLRPILAQIDQTLADLG